jgi:hypothetical protein
MPPPAINTGPMEVWLKVSDRSGFSAALVRVAEVLVLPRWPRHTAWVHHLGRFPRVRSAL